MKKPKISEVGMRYGRLVVVSEKTVNGRVHADCVCDCGKYITTKRQYLHGGDTKSCGCLRADLARAMILSPENQAKLKKHSEFIHQGETNLATLESSKINPDSFTERRGVRMNRNKFSAYIGYKNRVYIIGSFYDFNEAEKRRAIAEELLHEPAMEKYIGHVEDAESLDVVDSADLKIAVECILLEIDYDNLMENYMHISDIVEEYKIRRKTIYRWNSRGTGKEHRLTIAGINLYKRSWVDYMDKRYNRKKISHKSD